MKKGLAVALTAGAALAGTGYAVMELTGSDDGELAAEQTAFERDIINPLKQAMANGSCTDRLNAFAAYSSAAKQWAGMEVDIDERYGDFESHGLEGYESEMSSTCADEAYRRCKEDHDFSAVRLWNASIARQKEVVGDTTVDTPSEEALDKCLSFDLEAEIIVDYGPGQVTIKGKAVIPVKRDRTAPADQLVFIGELLPTPDIQVRPQIECRSSVTYKEAKKPARVEKMIVYEDTVGTNAMRRANERKSAARNAHDAARKEAAKADSAVDAARQAAAQAALQAAAAEMAAAEAASKAAAAKYSGTNFNKPRQIEFLFDPGVIASTMTLYCPFVGAYPVDMTEWYWGGVMVPFEKMVDVQTRMLRVTFDQNEIQGGELFARKTFPERTIEQMATRMSFTLWHRPKS